MSADGPARGWAGLGPLLVQFASRRDAEAVGAYELARIFASLPATDPGVGDGSELVHELVHEPAVTAALAKICGGWVGLCIHRALEAGASVDDVAAAAGLDRSGTDTTWRAWADRQVALTIAGRSSLEQADYDRVAGRLAGDDRR